MSLNCAAIATITFNDKVTYKKLRMKMIPKWTKITKVKWKYAKKKINKATCTFIYKLTRALRAKAANFSLKIPNIRLQSSFFQDPSETTVTNHFRDFGSSTGTKNFRSYLYLIILVIFI